MNDVNFVYGRDADVERLCNAVKDEEQHLCKLNKMPQGELSSLDDAEICDIDAPTASTVTARYYKGIGAHKDTMVLQARKVDAQTIEQYIVAMRGRNPENPSDKAAGIELEQRLKPQEDETFGTLTTDGSSPKHNNRVIEAELIAYDDYNSTIPKDRSVSPTLTTNCGASALRNGVKMIKVCQATENIPSVIELGNPDFYNFLYEIDGDIYLIRIRKLTPKECWKLMDFSDEDFEKAAAVNSNTQLYKQAGNSIVKNVLVAIMGQLFDGKEDVYRTV